MIIQKSNIQLLVDGAVEKYSYLNLSRRDLFDLVEHDIRHLGLPTKDYEEAIEYLMGMTT